MEASWGSKNKIDWKAYPVGSNVHMTRVVEISYHLIKNNVTKSMQPSHARTETKIVRSGHDIKEMISLENIKMISRDETEETESKSIC